MPKLHELFSFALLTTISVLQSANANAADEAAAELFGSLAGQWSCIGAFASGKALSADLSFVRLPDGRSVEYSHVDRAPNSYWQRSRWGVDKDTGFIVSLAFSGIEKEPRPSAGLYVAEGWSKDKVTLVQKRLLTDPFAENRFTYSTIGGKLKMVWEVRRGEEWKMGDYLDCDK